MKGGYLMHHITNGQTGNLEIQVTENLTINRTGKKGDEVLSTPSLLELMEQCSMNATDHLLAEGYTTVGYAVDQMRHLAPTGIGQKVRIEAILTDVNKNRLTYTINAFQGKEKIGMAIHKRAIISIQ